MQQSPFIWDLCYTKTRSGKSVDYRVACSRLSVVGDERKQGQKKK